MATKMLKGVFGSSMSLKTRTSSLHGLTQQRPCVRTTTGNQEATRKLISSQVCACQNCRSHTFHTHDRRPKLLDNKNNNSIISLTISAKTRALNRYLYILANTTSTSSSFTIRTHQWEGIKQFHSHQSNNSENKATETDTTPTPNPQDASTKPAPPTPSSALKCTCPDCHWFPFHKPNLLSRRDHARILRFLEDVLLYTPNFSGGPCDTPLVLVARYHLAGTGDFVIRNPFGPDLVTTRDDKKGVVGGKNKAKYDNEDDEDGHGHGNGNGNGNKMPRSGYDMTYMRGGDKVPRPAAGCEKEKNKGEKDNRHSAGKEKRGDDGKGPAGGPAPLEKREVTCHNVRLPLEGRGWTFWL